MKKIILIGVLSLIIVFLVGCGTTTQTPNKPSIVSVNLDKSFGVAGDRIGVAVSVSNPLSIDYNGNVLIQSDSPECFGMRNVEIGSLNNIEGYLSPISVRAGETNSGLITMAIPQNNNQDCYQPSNHELKIFLLQNEKTLDTEVIDFALFER